MPGYLQGYGSTANVMPGSAQVRRRACLFRLDGVEYAHLNGRETMDDRLHHVMSVRTKDGRLPCSHAFVIARDLGINPLKVGLAANEAGVRISRCQLGLFGYGPKAEGKHKIVHAMEEVPERLAARLRAEAKGEKLTCRAVWRVADGLGFQRLEASSAVEAMGLKVSRCQLGCFPRPWEG